MASSLRSSGSTESETKSLTLMLALSMTPEPRSLDAVVSEASVSHTPIVLDLYTQWCWPCRVLEHEVLPQPQVVSALKPARFVSYDIERDEGIKVAERFALDDYPTLLVLTPDGVEVGRLNYEDPEVLATHLTSLIAIAQTEDAPRDSTTSNARSALIAGFRAMTGAHADASKALILFDQVIAADPDNQQGLQGHAIVAAARLRYLQSTRALRLKTLLDLSRGDPSAPVTLNAMGAVAAFNDEASLAQLRPLTDRARSVLTQAKNTELLNQLLYIELTGHDTTGSLASADALAALSKAPPVMDSVAEAYFQAHQAARAVEIEEEVVRASANPTFKANLQRFKSEQPKAPPYRGWSLVDAMDMHSNTSAERERAELARLGALFSDECHALASKLPPTVVRVSFAGNTVSRAVAFDLEAPAALRKCLEKSARNKTSLFFADRHRVEIPVKFPLEGAN